MYKKLAILPFLLFLLACHVQEAPKVYDCFTFKGDLSLLEKRIAALSDKIDYFVLLDPPLDKECLSPYKDKILYHLEGCNENDVVFLSDIDYSLKLHQIEEIKHALLENRDDLVILGKGAVASIYKHVKRLSPEKTKELSTLLPKELKKMKIEKYSVL